MATLDNLLRYKSKVVLKHPKTGKDIKVVWVRLLGDEDLREAFKFSRIASAEKRAALRDKESDVYKDEIGELSDQSREDLVSLIVATRENIYANEAPVVVKREDLPEISEIAVQPDAPTLEEQERLDALTNEINDRYKKSVEDYIETKKQETLAELKGLKFDKVLEKAIVEFINLQALQSFVDELNTQRGYRGTYEDEECKIRGFSSIEAFKNADTSIKQQLINAYAELEMDNDDLKN